MEDKPLYNSRIISTFIEYLKISRPDIDAGELLLDSGINSFEVEDEGHWLTQRQVDDFHDALIRRGANPSIFREAGRYMVSSRSISAIRQFVMGFVTPIHAYTMLGKVASYLNLGATFKAERLSHNSVEIISMPAPGVNEKSYQCENRIGCIEAVAKLFTNKLPVLEHPLCIHRGDGRCRYVVSWEEPSFFRWRKVRNYLAISSVANILIAGFFLPPSLLAVLSLVLLCVAMGVHIYADYIEKKDIYGKIEMQGNAANRLLDQITISYNNSLLVKEIGQAVSSILDIDHLLKFVMDTLQKRLDFDRGMIMLANPEKTQLHYVRGFGYNREHEAFLKRTIFNLDNPKSRGPLVASFKKQMPLLIANVKEFKEDLSRRSYEFVERLGVKSFICVPIVYKGEPEGILAVDNYRTERPHNQSEVSLLMGVAPQIAISINNARAIQKIRNSEERFRSLGEHAPDIIYTVDVDAAFTYVNPAWERILGHRRGEVIGRNFIDFVKPEDVAVYERLFESIRKKGETITNFKGVLLAKDGTQKYIDISGAPNIDDQGNIIGIVGIFKDVTEQRQLENQLHHASKMEALGTLTGGISHDFNNIVQAISGYVQLLMMKKNEADPDWKYLLNIDGLAKRSTNLIKQLLLFSRQGESKLVPLNLNGEIRKFSELLTSTLPKTIKMNMDLADDLAQVRGDSSQLGQVIMNLVVNARDAMPGGGEIDFSTRIVDITGPYYRDNVAVKTGRYARLRVADTGGGIEPQVLPHIYDPFFTTKEPGKGTGIGLAVVYGIAKSHDGYIFCDSKPGRTVFDLYLPAMDEPADVREETEEEKKPSAPGLGTILLVDDEHHLLESGQDFLTFLGYQVLVAGSGEEALAVIGREKENISLIILDLMMPGMGGDECLLAIRKIAPSIAVIVVSGFMAHLTEGDLMRKGAAAFLAKPYRFEDLHLAIEEVLSRRVQPPEGRIPLQRIKGV